MTQKNKNLIVSVVIPCYGDLPHLSRALCSIELQTLLPYEVILVNDDAGLIGTNEISRMLKHHWKFQLRSYILTRNIGAGPARNIGWNEAKGEYIAFLDADDIWHPSKLEKQILFMESHLNIGITGHNYQLLSKDESLNTTKLTNKYKFISLLNILIKNPFITPSVVVRRSLSQRFHMKQRYSEDYRLWLEIAFSGIGIAKLSDPLAAIYKPLISGEGLSSNIWMMEYGELKAYLSVSLSRMKLYPLTLILVPYSLLKFIRRIIIRLYQKLIALG